MVAANQLMQLAVIRPPSEIEHTSVDGVIDIYGHPRLDGRNSLALNEEVGIVDVSVSQNFRHWESLSGVSRLPR
jgi:hypothetical protein